MLSLKLFRYKQDCIYRRHSH